MSFEHKTNERLFSYGTLQSEPIQISTFGRKLQGRPDAVVGYRRVKVRVEDSEFVARSGSAIQNNLQFTGNAADAVEGTVFELTSDELRLADAYEPEEYERVLVQLRSGVSAWVYLSSHAKVD